MPAIELKRPKLFDGGGKTLSSTAYGYYIDQVLVEIHRRRVFAGWLEELCYIGTFIGKGPRHRSVSPSRYGNGGPNERLPGDPDQKTQPYVTVLDDGEARPHPQPAAAVQQLVHRTRPWISGIYENQVIVKEDGIWRIHGMDLDYVWLGDYANGWTGIDPAASTRFGPTAEEQTGRLLRPDARCGARPSRPIRARPRWASTSPTR